MSTTRAQLFQILTSDAQRDALSPDFPNSALFYGTVVGGTSGQGWTVKFDDLPSEENEIKKVKRNRIAVLDKGEEEPRFNAKYLLQLEEQNRDDQKKQKKS